MVVKNSEQKETALEETEDEVTSLDVLGLEIKNLIVSPLPQLRVACGDAVSFIKMVKNTNDVQGVVWNERGISLITKDRTTVIGFKPEIYETALMFFRREEKRQRIGFMEFGPRVWEGEFEPIIFAKTKLLKFLKEQKTDLPEDVISAIKNMKIKETTSHNEEMLSLDTDDLKTTIEETTQTNIPKLFKISLPISGNFIGDLTFEASVTNLEDDYGHKTKRKGIQLRCINARAVLRDMMCHIVAKLPENIPKYYGAMNISGQKEKDDYW